MTDKIMELLAELTKMARAFTLLAEYALVQAREKDGLTAAPARETAPPEAEKPPRKPRAAKVKEAAPEPAVAAAEPDHDPLMPQATAVHAGLHAANGGMTEDESRAAAQDAAKAICQRFRTLVPAKAGSPDPARPEGFHMMQKILSEQFKVARIADLNHAQRIALASHVKVVIAEADRVPA